MLSVVDAPRQRVKSEKKADNVTPSRDVDTVFRTRPHAAAVSLATLLSADGNAQQYEVEPSYDGNGIDAPNWQYAIQTLNKCILNQRRFLGTPVTITIPWAENYPDLMEYYAVNAPDYTGMGLYAAFAYPNDHQRLLTHSPEQWVAQVMVSEFANPHVDDVKLLELRARVFDITNKRLSDPELATDPGTLQFILALVAVAVLSSFHLDSIKGHFRGMKSIFDLALKKGRPLAPWLTQLTEELDSVTS